MAASIRQWDTDWFNQFKTIMPTSFSNLQLYPGNALAWMNVVNVPFGNKQAERAIRMPDQDIQVAKDVKYLDKYAKRLTQTVDMPAIYDSLRIEEEFYAGDVVNALGHVSDLFENFNDGLANFIYTGTAIEPISYGLMDAGSGNGTIDRPVRPTDVTPAGKWDVQGDMFIDIASAVATLENAGFMGRKRIIAPPIYKTLLSTLLTSTITPYSTWIQSIAGYPITFTPLIDPNATEELADIFIVDENAFDLFMTPLKVRGFFDNNTEDFVWHWKTRAYLLARPKYNGTKWYKGAIQLAQVDFET